MSKPSLMVLVDCAIATAAFSPTVRVMVRVVLSLDPCSAVLTTMPLAQPVVVGVVMVVAVPPVTVRATSPATPLTHPPATS